MDASALIHGPDRRFFEEAGAAIVIGALTFARYMPAPPASRPWACALFDSIQDLCKNNDRIGQRSQEVNGADSAGHNKLG